MDEINKDKLRQLAEDDLMVDTLKKFLTYMSERRLKEEESDKLTNEALGQITRASIEAKGIINHAFNELKAFKGRDKVKESVNLAR